MPSLTGLTTVVLFLNVSLRSPLKTRRDHITPVLQIYKALCALGPKNIHVILILLQITALQYNIFSLWLIIHMFVQPAHVTSSQLKLLLGRGQGHPTIRTPPQSMGGSVALPLVHLISGSLLWA